MKPGFVITPDTPLRDKLLGGYTEAELNDAFARVRPTSHWKDPIDATVTFVLPEADIPLMKFAVAFFTATEATITPVPGESLTFRVTADGYRRGPAGDH